VKTYLTRYITPTKDVTFETVDPFSLEHAQALVGGYVEMVYLSNGKMMLLDEEGKLKGKPYNKVATLEWRGMEHSDGIVGNVLILENYKWD